jgi:hypothetical protein
VGGATPVKYQPYWCEENVWWLCHDLARDDPAPEGGRVGEVPIQHWALFITNERKSCALRHQRAGDPVVWDYHVVLVVERGVAEVWDLDTLLGLPLPLHDYLAATFVPVPEVFAPRFRLVAAADYLARFHTDRSHMRTPSGGWQKPPPSWPAPTTAGPPNQTRYWDVTDTGCGSWVSLAELRARFGGS